MATALQPGIVRIIRADGATGTGFLVRDRGSQVRILTVAHNIQSRQDSESGLARPIAVDFQFATDLEAPPRTAAVDDGCWRAPGRGDIALLGIDQELPKDVHTLPLGLVDLSESHAFRTMGFPAGSATEKLGTGTTIGLIGDRTLLQLGDANNVERGFSGGPLIATDAECVIAMVSMVSPGDEDLKGIETAQAIPLPAILEACPVLRTDEEQPYRGLEPFTAADARHFHGRERQVEDLARVLDSVPPPRIVGVYGPSGCGKSSLVRAGLSSHLADTQGKGGQAWRIIETRPAQAFGAAGDVFLAGLGPAALVEANTPELEANERILLVVDQFEELFVSASSANRQTYIDELVSIVDDEELDVTVMIVMRDDFQGSLSLEASVLRDRVGTTTYPVPMTIHRDDIRRMVQEPAANLGLGFDAGLAEIIVDDALAAAPVKGDPKRALSTVLPLLEDTLHELWLKRKGGRLTREAYDKVKGTNPNGVVGALPKRAEDSFWKQLSRTDHDLARSILTELVHLGDLDTEVPDSRQRVARQRLTQIGPSAESVESIVGRLVVNRLVIASATTSSAPADSDDQDERYVELIHDVLIREWGRLKAWIDGNREDLAYRNAVQRAAEEWVDKERTIDYLDHRGNRYNEARRIVQGGKASFEDLALEYLEACRQADVEEAHAEKKQRDRERVALVGIGVLGVAALLAAIFAFWFMTDADYQGRLARLRAIRAAQVSVQDRGEFDLAMLLSAVAYDELPRLRQADSIEALDALLEIQTGQPYLERYLHDHDGNINGIAVQPGSQRLLTADAEGQLLIRDLSRAEPEVTVATSSGGHRDLAISPDGRLAATGGCHIPGPTPGGCEPRLALWDAQSGDLIMELDAMGQDRAPPEVGARDLVSTAPGGHTDAVKSVVFDADGNRLFSGGNDGRIIAWSIPDGVMLGDPIVANPACVENARPGICGVLDLALGPANAAQPTTGRLLASSHADASIRLWDAETMAPAGVLDAGRDVEGIAWGLDGSVLAAAAGNGDVLVFDADTEKVAHRLPGHTEAAIRVAFGDLDGRQLLAAGSARGRILVWEYDEGDDTWRPWRQPLLAHADSVHALEFLGDGRHLISGGHDDKLVLWDLRGDTRIREPIEHDGGTSTRGLAYRPDGLELAAGQEDGRIILFSRSEPPARPRVLDSRREDDLCSANRANAPTTCQVQGLAYSPDGSRLIAMQQNGSVSLWDTELGSQLDFKPDIHADGVARVAFSRDGDHAATASQAGTDGLVVWSTSVDRLTVVRDVATECRVERNRVTLGASPERAACSLGGLAFHPSDADLLLTGNLAGAVVEWSLADGQVEPRRTLVRAGEDVFGVAYSPAEPGVLAYGLSDGRVFLKLPEDAEPRRWATLRHVRGVGFSPDGSVLAAVHQDGTMSLWDVATRQPDFLLGTPLWTCVAAADCRVQVLAANPGPANLQFATGSSDGTASIWTLDPGSLRDAACERAARDLIAEEADDYFDEAQWDVCQRYGGDGEIDG